MFHKKLFLCLLFLCLINHESRDSRYLYVSDKLLIACLPLIIWPLFSLFIVFCCIKLRKYETLGIYWSYCTGNRAITSARGSYARWQAYRLKACEINREIWETRKIFIILHSALCGNYNPVQKILEKLRKLRKSCNHKRNINGIYN